MGNEESQCASARPLCECIPMNQVQDESDDVSLDDLLEVDQRNVELYIQCKQEQLAIHNLPTERLRVSTRSIYSTFDDPNDISELEFGCFLGHQKLLQYRFKEDKRWRDFYKYFTTRTIEDANSVLSSSEYKNRNDEERQSVETYDFMNILTGLVCLSQSDSSVKSVLLCEYFTNRSFIKKRQNWTLWPRYYFPIRERPDNIKKVDLTTYTMKEQDTLKGIFLTSQTLRTILTVIVNLSLKLVPLFARDYTLTSAGRSSFVRFLKRLEEASQPLVDQLIAKFNGGPLERNALGMVSVFRFVEVAQSLDLYDTAEVRKRGLILLKEQEELARQRQIGQKFTDQNDEHSFDDSVVLSSADKKILEEMRSSACLLSARSTADDLLNESILTTEGAQSAKK